METPQSESIFEDKMGIDHDWKLLKGSNFTFKCQNCGILGHPPDKITKKGNIIPNLHHPYRNDCSLSTMYEFYNV